METKTQKFMKRVVIVIISGSIIVMYLILVDRGVFKKQTTPIRTNTQVEAKVAKNTVKSENKDKPKVCGLSTVTCESENETELVKKISAKYEVDWKLIEAIVRHETGNRTSLAYKNLNNVGGLMGSNGLMKFDTVEESYEFMIKVIKTYYIDMGLTTIEQIGSKYCPVGAKNDPQGINKFWVGGVKSIYENL